jgi:hypothetical protein
MKYEFEIEAGHYITRDGKPFVTIHKVEETTPTTDADAFARAVPEMIRLLGKCVECIEAEFPSDKLPEYAIKARKLLDDLLTIRP